MYNLLLLGILQPDVVTTSDVFEMMLSNSSRCAFVILILSCLAQSSRIQGFILHKGNQQQQQRRNVPFIKSHLPTTLSSSSSCSPLSKIPLSPYYQTQSVRQATIPLSRTTTTTRRSLQLFALLEGGEGDEKGDEDEVGEEEEEELEQDIDFLFEEVTQDDIISTSNVQVGEKVWRYVKKPLLSIGSKGATLTHGNSLRQLLEAHTVVKVKVNTKKFDGTYGVVCVVDVVVDACTE